ncbi:MAG: sulfotransferase [Methylococcales bacterium]
MSSDTPTTAPIFIVGTPRSGTTLTAQVLGRHSSLFMPGETHYLDDIYSRAEEIGVPDNDAAKTIISRRLYDLYQRYYEEPDQKRIEMLFKDENELKKALENCHSFRDIFDQFMNLQMQYENKQRWGNNAPRDLFGINDILEFFPDAKIIVCVRDVRGFLLSYQGKWKVTGDGHAERLKKLYHPVITSLLWKASMKLLPGLQARVANDNFIIVKYEDLVSSSENTVKNICKIIDVDFEPDMLNVVSHNSSNTSPDKGIFSTSIDKWKARLKPEEITISQLLCNKQLNFLGYDSYTPRRSIVQVLIIFVTTPYALWRALDANKEMRGPLLPYVYRRLSALIRS